jgi:hypothetical protein
MHEKSLVRGMTLAILLVSAAGAATAATRTDPDWPCIQRKVPELSLGQVWNGPELPASAGDWSKDRDISMLVKELAARRLPIDKAQAQIQKFATALSVEQKSARLTMLVQGLFDHMNQERSQVISGIARYAHKQLELAARLRKEASELDALRAQPNADAQQIELRTYRLTWETRVFEERVQSLTYVCEVPTLIEQRLYALSKSIMGALAGD